MLYDWKCSPFFPPPESPWIPFPVVHTHTSSLGALLPAFHPASFLRALVLGSCAVSPRIQRVENARERVEGNIF